MTRIDFYVLQDSAPGNRFTLACRLIEKAWQKGHRVLICTQDEEQTRHMDRLLWTHRDQSFIPHALLGKSDSHLNPVLITDTDDADDEHDVLINLCQQIPPFFSRFERVIECVDKEETQRAASRERFRFYRDRGYPLDTHQIS